MTEPIQQSQPAVWVRLFSGGMEISWMYAWATFVFLPLAGRAFPLLGACLLFFFAAGLTFLCRGRGWLVIQIAAVQMAGLIITMQLFLDPLQYSGKIWLMILTGFLGISFWIAGILFARRPAAHAFICRRFDWIVGSWILFLFLFALLKTETRYPDYFAEFLLGPFIFCSLLSLTLARSQSNAKKVYIEGYRKKAFTISFLVAGIITAAGAILLPLALFATRHLSGPLNSLGAQLGNLLASSLRFIFTHLAFRPKFIADTINDQSLNLPGSQGTPAGYSIGAVLNTFILSLIGLIILVMLFILLKHFWQWLFSRTAAAQKRHFHLLKWWNMLTARFSFYWNTVFNRSHSSITAVYRRLLAWGRNAGCSCAVNETPLEYGSRLSQRFPLAAPQIGLIVTTFSREVYGAMIPNSQLLKENIRACQSLRRPFRKLTQPESRSIGK